MSESFGERLTRLSSAENQDQRALVRAQLLVAEIVEKCRSAAEENADCGFKHVNLTFDPPMILGNRIPQERLVEMVREALEAIGLITSAKVEPQYNTNVPKMYVRMEWK